MIYVPGTGNPHAKLAVVGEAPGGHEEREGYPFAGPTGGIVRGTLRDFGVSDGEAYFTNVVKVRPPDNDIKRLKELGKSIEQFLPQLWEEILTIKPNCVLALGETALHALTGKKGIRHYRGSILPNCRSVLPKVVACLHPATLFHQSGDSGGVASWKELTYIRSDFERAVKQSEFPELRLPQRLLQIARSSFDVYRFLERHQDKDKATLDVETSHTIPVCIGLAFDRYEAMSIPILNILTADNPQGIPLHDLVHTWRYLAEFLMDCRIKIIAQNGKFDEKRCRQVGLEWHDFWFDIALGWHTLYSELPKKLEFISSIVTEEPYYKNELTEFNYKKEKLDTLLLYNAKDAVVEFECFEKIYADLEEAGMLDWFFQNMMPLHRLYYDLEDVGILVDEKAREQLDKLYHQRWKDKHEKLVELVGHEINPSSPQQVAKLLYGELRCPPRKDTQERTLKALMNNALKDQHRKDIVKLILEERKVRKTIGTYINAEPSYDGLTTLRP